MDKRRAKGNEESTGAFYGGQAERKRMRRRAMIQEGAFRRGSIKSRKKEEDNRGRKKDESKRRQRTEFIFINDQRTERELLKRKKMNERMSVNERGEGDDVCSLPAF